jgi:tetratricopeptide (TPR) repeat protein
MLFKWLDASEATAAGAALADDFYLQSGTRLPSGRGKEAGGRPQGQELQKFLQKFLQGVDNATRSLKLNFFKRAKLANSFKWRLLEKGVEKELVDELTQALVIRLTPAAAAAVPAAAAPRAGATKLGAKDIRTLHERGVEHLGRGALAEALACYEELLRFDPRDAYALNGAGSALAQLSRYPEAEQHLRRAIGIRESLPAAHFNLASVLLATGRYLESEQPLRRALKLKPDYLDARVSLGGTLLLLGRLSEARDSYEKALRAAPRNPLALVGVAQIDLLEGRFAEAEAQFRTALEITPDAPHAVAALARLRRMTSADSAWVKRAEALAGSGVAPLDESTLRFAIGKYYDDVGDYPRAFHAFQRANELQKLSATPYRGEVHAQFIDDLTRVYTRETLSRVRDGASDSERPVFVVGMPRSGTTLVEQILASHPAAAGAGELEFWTTIVHRREAAVRQALPEAATRKRLARDYLQVLEAHSRDALRVVDKAPINSDYLGLLHSVFPRARIILLRRDPIDTCLSCYFQQFSPVMNYAMDLSALASFYREHHRLMAHWRAVLPQETLLEVPYADLVGDQEAWTRRILEFVGLPWDARCMEFHTTARAVTSASSWQVRQKIFTSSLERWRNYEKFITPLLGLRNLA